MAQDHSSSTALTGPGPASEQPGFAGWLLERFCRLLGPVPLRFELWNGMSITPSRGPARATVSIASFSALLRLLVDRESYFGEAYRNSDVDVRGDLVGALEAVFEQRLGFAAHAPTGRTRATTLRQARRNARHHYDVGNAFYELWLDQRMLYTCAYFPSPELSLEAAQVAKMDHVCRKLRLRPDERVLEAGCGWGALARHMAARYRARVTACNVSREQIQYARAAAEAEGLGDRVTFVEDDFRNMGGRYDAFVSLGMLEHVGLENYGELGRTIHARIDPDRGRGLLHFIGRNRSEPLNPWIRQRIFPEAYPPTLAEAISGVLEPWQLSVLDVENLRRHYARTLVHWLARFDKSAEHITEMFDEAFTRTWRLYLAGAQAAFNSGWMQLFQVSFARPRDNEGPWTRASLYAEEDLGAL